MPTFINKTALVFLNGIYNNYYKKAFAKIGIEKQRVIEQIIPAINNNLTKLGQLYNPDYFTAISSGEDLHNIVSPGRYVCSTDSIALSLSNSPTNYAFVMKVEYVTSTMFSYEVRDYKGGIYTSINYIYSNANHFTAWNNTNNALIGVSTPSVYESRVSINNGGYYINGKSVNVNIQVTMGRDLGTNNNLQLLTGFPSPALTVPVCVASTVSPFNVVGTINTYGALEIRNRESLTTGQVLYISANYYTS